MQHAAVPTSDHRRLLWLWPAAPGSTHCLAGREAAPQCQSDTGIAFREGPQGLEVGQFNQCGHRGQISERAVPGSLTVETPGADIVDKAP